MKWRSRFYWLFAAGLFISALIKFFFVFRGGGPGLQAIDWVTSLRMYHLLWVAAAVETVIAWYLFFGRRDGVKAALVLGISSCFAAYRILLSVIGAPAGCPCLGLLPEYYPELRPYLIGFSYLFIGIGVSGGLFLLLMPAKVLINQPAT